MATTVKSGIGGPVRSGIQIATGRAPKEGNPWNKIAATFKTCGTVIERRAAGGAAFYPGDGAVTALGDSNMKYSRITWKKIW
jgi:hypothetical protein